MDNKFLLYLLAGLGGGFLGGMGMGGGTILIPILTIFLNCNGHLAQAVNLISFIPMAVVALIFHLKNKLIEKRGVLFIIIPAILFALLGSLISSNLNGKLLGKFFGGFLLALSVLQFFSDKITQKFND
jgi:uncharacterized membrane protein YfcA